MKCPKCGAENPINRIYCGECGAELEHDLKEIQATVDQEIRVERARATSRTIRWFLGAAIVLCVVGYYFRRAYKDLPANDLVAFASAPTVQVDDRVCAESNEFGVPLPRPRRPAKVGGRVDEAAMLKELANKAYQRTAVTLKQKGIKRRLEGLLVGDIVLHITPEGQAQSKAVPAADLRRLRPLDKKLWELEAQGLKGTIRATILDADQVVLQILLREADGTTTQQGVPLPNLEELRPL